MILQRTYTVSTVLRIAMMVLFLFALFGLGRSINQFVALDADHIFSGFQLWRLVTYPLGLAFGGLICGSIAFGQPGEEVENLMGRRAFLVALVLVTILAASLHLLLFMDRPDVVLAGALNISLFTMVGYVYLFPKSNVHVLFFSLSARLLLALMILVVVLSNGLEFALSGSPFLILTNGFAGLLLGILWFHLRYQKYPVLLKPAARVSALIRKEGEREQVGRPSRSQLHSETGVRRPPHGRRQPDGREEELNAILEKISERGVESLSDQERKFLDDYSSEL